MTKDVTLLAQEWLDRLQTRGSYASSDKQEVFANKKAQDVGKHPGQIQNELPDEQHNKAN